MLTYVPPVVTNNAADTTYQKMMESLESEVSNDSATVWVKDMEFHKFVLVKEGLNWKISEMRFDFAGLTNQLQDMMNQR